MMWVDSTLAGLMSGLQAMVGTPRFLLALQSEGRKSVEADWEVVSRFPDFREGFRAIAVIAAVAGWGEWVLTSLDEARKECRFRAGDSWEGRYQKALGVCWGSGMLAGKLAGYCSKLFGTNCWADQTAFIARGDGCDEFVVRPSSRSIEREIESLLTSDEATKADLAVAVRKLEHEVSERRRSEQALREGEEKFRSLVETTSDWIWEVDAAGVYTYASPRVRDLLGYEPDAIVGRTPFDLMPADEAERMRAEFASMAAERRPFFSLVNQNLRRDGRPVVLETSGVPRLAPDGTLLGYRGIDRDITERTRAEEALKEKEAFIQALLDTSRDWIWAIDGDAVHTYSNPAVEAILGYPPQEIVGRPSLALIHEGDVERVKEEVARCIAQQRGWSRLVVRWRHRDGSYRWLESNSVPVLDPGGAVVGFRGVDRDITERRRAEEERLELERRLLHSQKLESLGVLAGGIAHDFNNLLMAVIGNLDVALARLPPQSPARANIGQSLLAARRATDLTREMLAYSGRGRFVVVRLSLSELVRENVELLRAGISRTVTLKLSLAPEPAPIEADPAQVQQVIMNLLTNASEAIGERAGVVTLATGVEECEAAYLGRSRLEEKPVAGRYAFVDVSDTGCGMDAETQQRLFDPFYTTKFTGRGLGMSAVLGIVRGHKGAIIVDSEPGRGTSIRVLFPVCEGRPELPTRVGSGQLAEVRPGGRSGLVLVADDEETVRDLCLAYAEELGFAAVGAADGDEALKLFEKHDGGFSFVLLDLTMPSRDGVATLRAMKALRADVPVFLISGYDQQDAMRRFSEEGFAGFLQKPFLLQDLAELVAGLPGQST
jgi:PAS domain S-box-containing protein